jgi:hypothetical protein
MAFQLEDNERDAQYFIDALQIVFRYSIHKIMCKKKWVVYAP